ncbi:indolepyruvate oxidoreductase subunit beta [Candidatus Bathyarchaeota archaeon]|nr:indolepyruvate oxidoreductase subunit beta [Candidatus Bathyarchaeota archaeon]
MSYNILLVGVGGQGLMTLSGLLGEACVDGGVNVVTQEQHGLAQRSGSISAHVRMGDAYSPMTPIGEADLIIAMEAMEALRYIEYLRPGGDIVMNNRVMHPVIETNELVKRRSDNLPYVTLEQILGQLRKHTEKVKTLDANGLASMAGNPRTENIVLLGAASTLEGFPLSVEVLKKAIEKTVPKRTIDENLRAFELGRGA